MGDFFEMIAHKKLMLALAFVVSIILITLLIVGIRGIIYKPVSGQVIQSVPTSTPNSFNLAPITVSTPYATYNYPSQMTSGLASSVSTPVLLSKTYTYTDIETWILALTINKLNNSNIHNDSSYALRADNPQRYLETTKIIGTNKFYIFEDLTASGFSEVAISQNGLETADISLMGNDINSLSNLNSTFSMVLNSWNWK